MTSIPIFRKSNKTGMVIKNREIAAYTKKSMKNLWFFKPTQVPTQIQ